MSNTGAIPAGFLSTGAVVDDVYVVQSFIGAGAAGQVYKVRHNLMQREFALKIMMGTELSPQALVRFQNEAKVIARLDHPGIVRVYNSGSHMGRVPYYVMDLIEGETLDHIIVENGPLPILDAIDLFIAVCGALQAAHDKGVVHRDIKPSNIVLSQGEGPIGTRVKVVDFGIAKLAGRDGAQALTSKGDIFGSPLYMSPEQCVGSRIDARSDIYSLGCTMFEAITGNPPFHGKNIVETFSMHQDAVPPKLSERSAGKKIPKALDELVDQILEKLPDDRCQTMSQVAGILSIARGELLGTSAQQSVTRTVKLSAEELKDLQKEPNHFLLPIGVLLALLMTVGAGIAIFSSRLDPHKAEEPLPQKAKQPAKEEKTEGLGFKDIASGLDKLKAEGMEHGKSGNSHERIKVKPGEFYDGPITMEGMPSEQFNFPLADNGGTISYLMHTGQVDRNDPIDVADSVGGNMRMMHASVYDSAALPANVRFTFKPSVFARFNTEYMTGFRKTDIVDLDLGGCRENLNKLVQTGLNYFTGLKSFRLEDSSADDDTLSIISHATKLDNLELKNTKCTNAKLLEMPNLSRLRVFSSPPLKGPAGPLLNKITGRITLKELYLDSASLTKADFERIAAESTLVKLELANCTFRAEDLRELSKLRHLRELVLTDAKLNVSEIADNLPTGPSFRIVTYETKDMDQKSAEEGFLILHKTRPSLTVQVRKRFRKDDIKTFLQDKDD